jgi:hypothetical protein
VYRKNDGRDASRRKSRDGKNEGFFVTPVGENQKDHAKWLNSVDELSYFLLKNPSWKVYFGDNQQNRDVVVEG